MTLLIDTTDREKVILALVGGEKKIARVEKSVPELSERLLPEIDKLLRRHKIKLVNLEMIAVNPGPGGFSTTRTGVATANALGYALGIPVAEWPNGIIRKVVLPKYDKEPNITRPKP